MEAAPEPLAPGVARSFSRARRQDHLLGMAQVEGELGGGRMRARSGDRQRRMISCSHGGIVRVERRGGAGSRHTRRFRPRSDCGSPNGRSPVAKKYSTHAEREDVAARIVADAEHLLRRHVGRGAVGQAEFLGHQVGQLHVGDRP